MARVTSNATAFMLGICLAVEVKSPAWVVGIILTSSYFTELLLSPLMGALSDRFGRKLFILLGPLVGTFGVQVYPLSILALVLIFGRLLEGVSAAVAGPATPGFLSDVTAGEPKRRSRILSLFEISTVIGLILGQAIGGPIWDLFGKEGFRWLALGYLLISILIFFFVEESLSANSNTKRKRTDSRTYFRILIDPQVLTFIPAWVTLNAVGACWLNFAPFLLKSGSEQILKFPGQLLVGGYSGTQASLFLLGYSLAFAGGMGLWTLAYGKFRKTTIMLINLTSMTLATICLLILNSLDISNWQGIDPSKIPTEATNLHQTGAPLPTVVGVIALLIIGIVIESSFTPAALTHLVDISRRFPMQKGGLLGFYSVLWGVGNLLGGWLGGPFVELWGFNGIVFFTLLMLVVAFFSIWLVRRNNGDFVEESEIETARNAITKPL